MRSEPIISAFIRRKTHVPHPQCTSQSAGSFIIIVNKDSQHHGFAFLSVKAQLDGSEDDGREYKLGRETVILRYDGSRYQPVTKKWWLVSPLLLNP